MKAGARSLIFGRTVDQYVLLARGQIFEGLFKIDVVAIGGQMDELEEILRC